MQISFMLLVPTLVFTSSALADPEAGLGQTVRSNIATQTINMDPHYEGALTEGGSGQRSAEAVLRYKLGKLKPLLRTNGKPELGAQGGAQDTPTAALTLLGAPN